MTLYLENTWTAAPAPEGTWSLTLTNLGDEDLKDFTLAVTTITRIMPVHHLYGAKLLKRTANYHHFAPLDGLTLAPGQSLSLIHI